MLNNDQSQVSDNKSIKEKVFRTVEQDHAERDLYLKDDEIFDYHDFKIPRRELTLICGYTGHGKTAFAIDIAVCMEEKGLKVAFITCELSSSEIRSRIERNISEEYSLYEDLKKNYKIDIFDTTRLDESFTLDTLKKLVSELVEDKYDAIFLDYLQFIDKTESDVKKQIRIYMKDIASFIQNTSKKHNLYFVCTAQNNKESATKYTLLENTNIAESSDIVRNAGYVLGLFKMKLNQEMQMNKDEKTELYRLRKSFESSSQIKENRYYMRGFVDPIYVKEQKSRRRPLKPSYRLLGFNYGLCKAVGTVYVDDEINCNNNKANKTQKRGLSLVSSTNTEPIKSMKSMVRKNVNV